MILFTIPHEVVCKNFVNFLGTANIRNNSLLVRAISIVIYWIHFLVKLHGEPWLSACLNKIKVLPGKHFSVTLRRI